MKCSKSYQRMHVVHRSLLSFHFTKMLKVKRTHKSSLTTIGNILQPCECSYKIQKYESIQVILRKNGGVISKLWEPRPIEYQKYLLIILVLPILSSKGQPAQNSSCRIRKIYI